MNKFYNFSIKFIYEWYYKFMIKFFLKFCTNIIILILFILSLSISLVYSSELKKYDGKLNNYLMYCNKPKWDSLKKTYDYNLYKLTEYVTISKYTLHKREKGKWILFCKEIEFYKHTAICSKDYKFTKELHKNELKRLYINERNNYYTLQKADTEELTLNFKEGLLVSEIYGKDTSDNLIQTEECKKHH